MIDVSMFKKIPFDGELICRAVYTPLEMAVHLSGRNADELKQGTLQLLKEKLEIFEVDMPEELKCLK